MRPLPLAPLIAVAIAAAGVTGCGGDDPAPAPSAPAPAATATTPPAAAPRAPAGPAAASRVIRRWADTLRRSDVPGAAALFAVPALVQVNPALPAARLTRRAAIEEFNASLPCGAVLVRTERRGDYVEGIFRLTERPGMVCDGPGATARAAFLIRDGRIVEWRRRLDDETDRDPPPRDAQPAPDAAQPAV